MKWIHRGCIQIVCFLRMRPKLDLDLIDLRTWTGSNCELQTGDRIPAGSYIGSVLHVQFHHSVEPSHMNAMLVLEEYKMHVTVRGCCAANPRPALVVTGRTDPFNWSDPRSRFLVEKSLAAFRGSVSRSNDLRFVVFDLEIYGFFGAVWLVNV